MSAGSPFGSYAGIVAAIAALAVLFAWVGGAVGVAGLQPSAELNAAAYIILGAIFGTGAGALVVANGAGRAALSANTRLDAMQAPSGPLASAIVKQTATETAAAVKAETEAGTFPNGQP